MQFEQDFLLVLDDFHLINSKEVPGIVTFFLEHMPDNMHLLISTRSDPTLNLARIRSQNQLIEMRASELRFSAHDISTLFNKRLRLGLSNENIYALESKTEGWIAGLQLAALSLHGQKDVSSFIEAFTGNNRYIMDYLIEEVLKNQPGDITNFLLHTSIFRQFSAPLIDVVLNRDDSQTILEALERKNVFVFPLDEDRQWYRYHHLFADLLRQKRLLKDKKGIEQMHIKASAWFEKNNMYSNAIEHTLEVKDYENGIRLLELKAEDLWREGNHNAILKYGDVLPDALIKKHPVFSLYYAWTLINTGQTEGAESFLLSAVELTRKRLADPKAPIETKQEHQLLLGRLSVALAHFYAFSPAFEKTFGYSKTAMEYLSKDDSLWLGWAWYFIGIAEMGRENISNVAQPMDNALQQSKKSGNVYLVATIASMIAYNEQSFGNYTSSHKVCTDLLKYMQESGFGSLTKVDWGYAGLYTMMSVAESIWTDFDAALDNARLAYQLSKNENNITNKMISLLALSYVLHGREDKEGAVSRITELEEIMQQNRISPYIVMTYVGWKIQLLIEAGQLEEANDFVKKNGLALNEKITLQNEHSYIFYARLLLEEYKLEEAESMLSDLYNFAHSSGRVETPVQLKILYAILYKMKIQEEKAIAALMEGMELATEENLLVYFLFNLNFTLDLLKKIFKIHATSRTTISKEFIEKIKRALAVKEKRRENLSASILTGRELETLQLLSEDLSNQEIANRLFISLDAVKTRLKKIYIKLEVDSRTKAVKKVQALGLIE